MNVVRSGLTSIQNAMLAPKSNEEVPQLTQAQVPLELAGVALSTPDENGRIPIVIVPSQPSRVRSQFMVLAIVLAVSGIVAWWWFNNSTLGLVCIIAALAVTAFAVYRSFYVIVPEGTSALLVQGGQHRATLGSGVHVVRPMVAVSHMVTRREIPYDAPVVEAPTKDNVRASIDVLVTFIISDPARFVFSISPTDFDQVFQAACQDAVRRLVRTVTWEQITALAHSDTGRLKDALTEDVSRYGVTISGVNVTYAAPPLAFIESEEGRQLAILQRAEQEERQLLAERRQNDEAALERLRIAARVNREREAQELEAETRRRIAEIDAETDAFRLAKRDDAVRRFPLAAQYELQQAQLDVVRSLAGNSRAVVQLGNVEAISRALVIRDVLDETASVNGAISPEPAPVAEEPVSPPSAA